MSWNFRIGRLGAYETSLLLWCHKLCTKYNDLVIKTFWQKELFSKNFFSISSIKLPKKHLKSIKITIVKLFYRNLIMILSSRLQIYRTFSFFSKNAFCQFFCCTFYVVCVILIWLMLSNAKLNILSVDVKIKKIKRKLKIWCKVKVRLAFEIQKWGAIILSLEYRSLHIYCI